MCGMVSHSQLCCEHAYSFGVSYPIILAYMTPWEERGKEKFVVSFFPQVHVGQNNHTQ